MEDALSIESQAGEGLRGSPGTLPSQHLYVFFRAHALYTLSFRGFWHGVLNRYPLVTVPVDFKCQLAATQNHMGTEPQ